MTVSQALAEMLRACGVERAYGLPGEDHMAVLDALEKVGIRYVTAFNESSAAIMAETEALATGTIGVVIVTLAPGITNTINGIADAYLNRAPLLVIAGQMGFQRDAVIVRQRLDNFQLVDSIVKWSARCSQHVHQILGKAIEIATTRPCGPVFLELTDEISQAEAKDEPQRWLPAERLDLRDSYAGLPAPATIERLTKELAKAQRPVMLVGSSPHGIGEREAIEAFAERFACPVFTTPAAKGLVRRSCGFFAGTFLNGNIEERIAGKSDLILAVDLDGFDFFSRPWPYGAKAIGIERVALGQRIFPASLTILADVATVLKALPAPAARSSVWTVKEVAAYRESVRETLLVGVKVGGTSS